MLKSLHFKKCSLLIRCCCIYLLFDNWPCNCFLVTEMPCARYIILNFFHSYRCHYTDIMYPVGKMFVHPVNCYIHNTLCTFKLRGSADFSAVFGSSLCWYTILFSMFVLLYSIVQYVCVCFQMLFLSVILFSAFFLLFSFS